MQCFRRRYLLELGRSFELYGVRALAAISKTSASSSTPASTSTFASGSRVGGCDSELSLGAHLLRAQLVALRAILRRYSTGSATQSSASTSAPLMDAGSERKQKQAVELELLVGSCAPVALTLTQEQLARLRCALERAAMRSSAASAKLSGSEPTPKAGGARSSALQIALRVGPAGAAVSVVSTYAIAGANAASSEKLLASLQKLASS